MAVSITCPGCDADYSVPENLIGKSIRCKSCSETIAVKAVKAKAAARPSRDEDDDDDAPRSKPAARRRFADEDDDQDDVAPKKSNTPMLVGGLLALLVAGGVGGYFAFAGKDETPVVNNFDGGRGAGRGGAPRGVEVVPGMDPARKSDDAKKAEDMKKVDDNKKADDAKTTDDTAKAADTKKDETKKEDTKKDDVAKTDDTKKPEATKPDDKKTDTVKKDETKAPPAATVDPVNAISDRPVPGVEGSAFGKNGMSYRDYMDGRMDPLTLEMVKKASVHIFAESSGGAGEGSGWFGLEPGLVFTNAHVLNMIAPNSPKPKKVEFTLNAGTPEQRKIPHANIKILAVDQEIDLAICMVSNEKNLPVPLKIRPSANLAIQQGLTTVGYPFGSRAAQTGDKPEVSIRPSRFSAPRHDQFGRVRRIQIEGGVYTGNSGGPIVDAEGVVMGVVVEVQLDSLSGGQTQLGLGVPTEYVLGLAAGRIATTYQHIAYKDGDKVRIPIKMDVLDPLDRLKTIGIAAWIGNPSKKFRLPGIVKPKTEPGDRDYIETELKYDSKAKIATGEIVLPAKPDGTVYWLQPYYSNPIVSRYWEAGQVYERGGDPATRESANLAVKLTPGKTRNVTMSQSALQQGDGEDVEGEGEANSKRVLLKFGLTVTEQVLAPDPGDSVQAAKLRLQFSEMPMPKGVRGGREQDAIPKSIHVLLNNEVKKCGAGALVNKEGRIYKWSINTINVQQPELRYFTHYFTQSAIEALEATSIPLPNREVKPDETWESTQNLSAKYQDPPPRDRQGRPIPNAKIPPERVYNYTQKLTMKYIGKRVREGKHEAMVLIEGKISQASGSSHAASGVLRGWAAVEIDSGVVLEAHIDKEYDIDTSEKGVKKNAVGVFKYDVKRSDATN